MGYTKMCLRNLVSQMVMVGGIVVFCCERRMVCVFGEKQEREV